MALFWLFIVLPLVEIWVMIEVGSAIGAGWTIMLIVLSAILGVTVMRRQGMAALADLRASVDQLRDPARPMAHGALILMAGALLVVPGFVTDAVGALLLIRPVRDWLIGRMARRVVVVHPAGSHHPRGSDRRDRPDPGGRVIDAEYEVVDAGGADDDGRAPGSDSSTPSRGRVRPGDRPPSDRPSSGSGWTRG